MRLGVGHGKSVTLYTGRMNQARQWIYCQTASVTSTVARPRCPSAECTATGTPAGSLPGSSEMILGGLGGAKMLPVGGDNARRPSAARSAENTRGLRKLSTARAVRRPRCLPVVFSASLRTGRSEEKHTRPSARAVPHTSLRCRDMAAQRNKIPSLVAAGITPDTSRRRCSRQTADFLSHIPNHVPAAR